MCQSEVSLRSVIRNIACKCVFRSVAVAQALAQKRLSKVSVTKVAYECCVEEYLEVSVA